MSAQQKSHHLHRAREIGPRRQFDLHALIAKELGLSTAPKRRNRMVIALRISAFVGGVTIVAHVPLGTGSGNAVVIQSKVNEAQELSDRIREYKHIQITEVAMSGFSKTKGLAADWTNASPISVGLMFSRVSPSLPSQNTAKTDVSQAIASLPARPVPTTRTALSPEARLELEIWRLIAHAGDTERYQAYLRRYPFGAFADIATARVKALRKSTKEAAVRRGETAKSIRPSQDVTENRPAKAYDVTTLTSKTTDRCWYRNIEACRQRCREGEMRACSKLRRLGG